MDWEEIQLSKIFRLTNGKSISNDYSEIENKEYCFPIYGGNSILGYSKKYLLEEETLIIGRVGEYCGNVNLSCGKIWVSDNALYISEWFKDFDIKYIYYLLNYTNLNRYNDATGQPKITQSLLKRIKPKIPLDVEEQTAIASILSKVDEAIQSTQNSIKAAEKLKKGLMQNLLTGKLKPDGTWRTEDEFYKDEKFGNVPMGWETTLFGKRIVVQYGKSQKEIVADNGTIPIYGTGGIIEYGKEALFSNESILIGRKGTIDKPFYLNHPFWAVDTTYYVESFEGGNIKYLFYLLQTKNLKSLNEATGVPSLTRRTLNRLKLILPPIDIQIEIVKQFDAIENFCLSKEIKAQKLQRLKKSLMQNLLTGKIRVDVERINELFKEQQL